VEGLVEWQLAGWPARDFEWRLFPV
jgi:hypothetical protein